MFFGVFSNSILLIPEISGALFLEKSYGRDSREALRQGLRMCDVGGKLLNGIGSTYVNVC